MTRTDTLAALERLELHTEVVVETDTGNVVTGSLTDYSSHHLWLDGHDHEDTHHARPWRARLSAVTRVERVPEPPRWSWAAVAKHRRERL
ncbi:hypothetical protein ACIBFB_26470 [Nocardiopsis sp. NPDC050513]|uniref:hypothetical protein n=1 Tax=Nocardiopsis sp. NPDC050513 TaxID=3364338 RepID=UPI00379AB270